MHYVLLFPYGTGGFNMPPTRSRTERYRYDPSFIRSALNRPSVSRTGRQFTLFEWLKAFIFQSMRFRCLGRLGQAFMLDEFARWQRDEFDTMRDNPNIQQFRAPRRAIDDGTVAAERRRINVRMPRGVIGSKKYLEGKIAGQSSCAPSM
jgi:hypothetical protein